MLAAKLAIGIVAIIFTMALCKAASRGDRWEEKWIEQRKKEEQEGKA